MDQNRIEGAAREGAGVVRQAAGSIMGDTGAEIGGRIDELAGQAQRAMGRAMDDVRDTASYYADHANEYVGEYMGDYVDGARQHLDTATGTVSEYVRANPLLAIGAAFAIGVFLGSRR